MIFLNVKLKYKLNLKSEPLRLELLLKQVLRRRKRSDCGVSNETLGIYFMNVNQLIFINNVTSCQRIIDCITVILLKNM